jgi:hypothetical protein
VFFFEFSVVWLLVVVGVDFDLIIFLVRSYKFGFFGGFRNTAAGGMIVECRFNFEVVVMDAAFDGIL